MTTWLLQAARAIRPSGWSRCIWPMMITVAPWASGEPSLFGAEPMPVSAPLDGPHLTAPQRESQNMPGGKEFAAPERLPAVHSDEATGSQASASPQLRLTDRRGPAGYTPLELWRSAQQSQYPRAEVQRPAPAEPAAKPSHQAAKTPAQPATKRSYLPLQLWQQAQRTGEPTPASAAGASGSQRLPTVTTASIEAMRPAAGMEDKPALQQTAFTQDAPVLKAAAAPPEDAGVDLPMRRDGMLPGDRTQAETVDAPAVLPEPENIYEIDLPTTIRLVLSANPSVVGAREAVREMLALQTKARSMLLPSLNAGTAFHNHQGNFQSSTGQIKDIYSKSLYYGGGTRVWAAESLAIPMVRIFGHLGDAIYEPLAVRQEVSTKRFDATATANTLMLTGVIRYFDLLNAEARYLAAKQTELETAEIVRITASYALTGQGREGDANRARAEAYLMHTEVQRAEGRVAEASARLAELLSLNPSTRLKTVGGPIAGINLFGPNEELEPLIRMAERRRPEMGAATTTVQMNSTRVRQEQTRPLFPLVSLGYSAGSFGGGSVLFPPKMGNFGGRQDFDVLALWSLQNLGMGNRATVSERRAVLDQSRAQRTQALNGIRQEVIAAYGLLQGERIQIQITQRQLRDTEEGFREEFLRLRSAEALPIEVLNSVNQLGFARKELIKAVTAFNQAQFRLLVATGIPPTQAISRGLDQPITAPGNPANN